MNERVREHVNSEISTQHKVPEQHLGPPPKCSVATKFLGKTILKVGGWQLVGREFNVKNFVVIAAPHTSNWDLLWLLGAAWSLGIHINWLAKSTVFWGPIGGLFRAMGGIAVDRNGSGKLVEKLSQKIERGDGIALVIPPEGTRQYLDHWKSGFYRISQNTGVPILCSFLDYSERKTGIGPFLTLTGDVKTDMDSIRRFYTPFTSRYPANTSKIRLTDEPK